MTDEQRKDPPPEGPEGDITEEKRREERYRVPSLYQRYITLQVKSRDDFSPVVLDDFSRSGILFVSPAPFEVGSAAECLISMPGVFSRDIAFGIIIKYCMPNESAFLVGAAIDTVADAIWFDIFVEVHDFMKKRRDDVY
jgi:hypothetical protein